MTDDDFIAAIQADPGNDSLRLVYADWLEERGDRRGEYLRLLIAIIGVSDQDPRFQKLCERLRSISAEVDIAWLSKLNHHYAEIHRRVWRVEIVVGASEELGLFSATVGMQAPVLSRDWLVAPTSESGSFVNEEVPEHIEIMRAALQRMRRGKE